MDPVPAFHAAHTICRDQHVAVYGAAAGVQRAPDADRTILANVSSWLATTDLGLHVDLAVCTGRVLASPNVDWLPALAGRAVPHMLVLATYAPLPAVAAALDAAAFACPTYTPIQPVDWAACVADVVGAPLGRHVVEGRLRNYSVSTGVFCACLALAAGAATVTLCGISLQPGYGFACEQPAMRVHAIGDHDALTRLAARHGARLRTTSGELHTAYGFAWTQAAPSAAPVARLA
jgi:hypothetical protein